MPVKIFRILLKSGFFLALVLGLLFGLPFIPWVSVSRQAENNPTITEISVKNHLAGDMTPAPENAASLDPAVIPGIPGPRAALPTALTLTPPTATQTTDPLIAAKFTLTPSRTPSPSAPTPTFTFTPLFPTEEPEPTDSGPVLKPGQSNPCVSYYDKTKTCLRFICFDSLRYTPYRSQIVDRRFRTGMYSSLDYDSGGEPRIAYYDQGNGDLRLAIHANSKWKNEAVDTEGNVGAFVSMQLDKQDRAWIAYYDTTNGSVKTAHQSASGWDFSTIEPITTPGENTYEYNVSLSLDLQGSPYVAFYNRNLKVLRLAHWTGSDWEIGTMDDSGNAGMYASLMVDYGGDPAISYYDTKNAELKFIRRVNGAWRIEVVDKKERGMYSSLVLDSRGNPHISYFSDPDDRLYYADFTTERGWQIERPDNSPGSLGFYSAIALDPQDRPYIAYYDWSNGWLKIANITLAKKWNTTVISGKQGKVEGHPSIHFAPPEK